MKKIFVIIPILISFLMGNSYSDGYKLYKEAKKELRKGNDAKATTLFLEAKNKFSENKTSSQSLVMIAKFYCNGWGVDEDKNKAKIYLQKAQDFGLGIIPDKCLKNLK